MKPDMGSIEVATGATVSLLSLGLGFNQQLTGRDNVILSSMFNGYSRKEAKDLAKKIKEFSELGEFFEQPVRTYSSGMRSRLGFSAGLITKVDVLLIDEVLAVGDKEFKQKAEAAMLEHIGGNDQTVLFVSHSERQIKKSM
ncbi:teichoic acid export ATP-binding protein tagH [Vibrio ishigakensis]|uniref:Teichoic acid export ATP-binding protein tagH n=1 Tax=Vibrio ishigakensis TaxID=1481914 RepID=A0A0B8P019_9VIBR|nr:teichoic acid export ATP-binding protein tagH [Vibrio ishigakensis]